MADPRVEESLDYLLDMYQRVHTNDRRNTAAGHWINESFVIRLHAVLNSHGVLGDSKSIDWSLPGAKSVDLCRRLRMKFSHATGDIRGADAVRLDAEMREHYGLGEQASMFDGKFILSKDTVLRPMYSDCLQYCRSLVQQESQAAGRSS